MTTTGGTSLASPEELKAAMSVLASGVCLVSTSDEFGNRLGATVTAVSSVSAEPPLVLVCLDLRSGVLVALRGDAAFGIHVLSEAATDIAWRFARFGDEKFEGVPSKLNSHGTPLLLRDSLAVLECTPWRIVEAGDHAVVIGLVTRIEISDELDRPLLFFNREMHTLDNRRDLA